MEPRNWLNWGRIIEMPERGCIVVFSFGDIGHVGFFVSDDGASYVVLGGNQSDQVQISRFQGTRPWIPHAAVNGTLVMRSRKTDLAGRQLQASRVPLQFDQLVSTAIHLTLRRRTALPLEQGRTIATGRSLTAVVGDLKLRSRKNP